MKTLLQLNETRSLNHGGGEWANPQDTTIVTTANVEWFHRTEPTPTVARIDPSLLARFSCRAPGVYQAGE